MRVSFAALLLFAATAAHADGGSPPLQQLDHPVLAVGDQGQFSVQVPAYAGGLGGVAYAAHALLPGSDEDRGYRFTAVACPQGFVPWVHYDDRGVACSRSSQAAHPAFEMRVTVVNVDAAEGETMMADGLRGIIVDQGPSEAPWRIYGVVP